MEAKRNIIFEVKWVIGMVLLLASSVLVIATGLGLQALWIKVKDKTISYVGSGRS